MRSRNHDDIQRLHGTMPLWGLDRWVSLGDLFVDVNILELTSSNRRSELHDLWQDFTRNNSNYRSLDRIGLSNQQQRVSGLAVLKRDTNLMVVGKPGSGKTTYLQRIITECNESKLKANRIPVLIKLREFVDDGRKYAYNLEQFLEGQWQLSNTDIELILNQGLALILLDGLDEVVGEAGKQITQEIKRFARSYSQVQIIVTCRTQSQESKFSRFDYLEVADFNQQQVEAFAKHWFVTVCTDIEEGKTKAEEFLSQLFREENKPIRELAITPILLSLTCAVFQQTGKFYSKRSKLYEEGLELLLEQWDKSREVTRDEIYRDLSLERKLELLSYIAVKKFEQEQYVLFEQAELEGYIGEFLGIERQESRSVLKAIASQHGLLIERARGIWSFSHLTFQEYLVGRWFVDNMDWEGLLKNITRTEWINQWKQVFLLAVEMTNNAEHLLVLMQSKINRLFLSDFIADKQLNEVIKYAHEKYLMFKKSYHVFIGCNSEIQKDIKWGYDSFDFNNNNTQLFYLVSTYKQLRCISYEEASIKDNITFSTVDGMEAELATLSNRLDNIEARLSYIHSDLLFLSEKYSLSLQEKANLIDFIIDYYLTELVSIININILINIGMAHFFDIANNTDTEKINFWEDFRNYSSLLSSRSFEILRSLSVKLDKYKTIELCQRLEYYFDDLDYRPVIKEIKRYIKFNPDWYLSKKQISVLVQYFNFASLLVTCLNTNCEINREARERIEDSLLSSFIDKIQP